MSEARWCNLTNKLQRGVERSTCPGPRSERGREDQDQKYYQKKQMMRTEGSCNTRRMMLMRIKGSTNYSKDDEKEAMLCGCVMLVCTLVGPVVSACEWRGMLANTLVYQPGSRSRKEQAKDCSLGSDLEQAKDCSLGSDLDITISPVWLIAVVVCRLLIASALCRS